MTQINYPQVQTPDLGNMLVRAYQVRALKDEADQQNAFSEALATGAYKPGGGVDQEGLRQIMARSPKAGMTLMEKENAFAKSQFDTRKAQQEYQAKKLETAGNLLAPLMGADDKTRAERWAGARAMYLGVFPEDADKVPAAYDPAYFDQVTRASIGAKEMYKQGREAPKTRDRQVGGTNVTEEWDADARAWREVGRGPKWKAEEAGFGATIQMPDGTVLRMGKGGGEGLSSGLQKPTQNKVEADLLNIGRQISQVNAVENGFKPEYQTFGTRLRGMWAEGRDKLGLGMSANEKVQQEGFINYRANASRLLAETLRDMSGAAITESEAKRLQSYIPTPGTGLMDGDSPVQAQTKIKNFRQQAELAQARLNYVRKNGFSIENVPLDNMRGIMGQRAQELAKEAETAGIPPEQRAAAVKQSLAREFGLTGQ